MEMVAKSNTQQKRMRKTFHIRKINHMVYEKACVLSQITSTNSLSTMISLITLTYYYSNLPGCIQRVFIYLNICYTLQAIFRI